MSVAVLRLASELMASWGELPRDTILVAPTEGAAVPLRGKTRVRVPIRGFDTLDHLELVTLGSRGEHRAQDVAGRLSDA